MTAAGVVAAATGVLLLAAGTWKIRHRRLFRGALRAQGLHSASLLALLSRAVPLVELFLGASLVLAPWLHPAVIRPLAVITTGFGLALLGYVTFGFIRFRGEPCGCLSADEKFGAWSFVRATLVAGAGMAMLAAADMTFQATSWVLGLVLGLLLVVVPRVTAEGNRPR